MHRIEKELVKATAYKPKPGLARQEVLQGLIKTVQGLSDDDWDGLSRAARRWTNDGVDAIKAKTPMPDFEDEAEATPPEAKENEVVKKAKKRSSAKAGKKAAASATAPKAAAKPKAKGVSAQLSIKRLMIKQPLISVDDLTTALVKQGFKPTKYAVATIRHGFRHSVRVIQEWGGDIRKLQF